MYYKIFSRKEELTEGLFGQVLIWLLEILNDLEKYNINTNILFDINALAYDNIIPTFIIPKNTYNIENINQCQLLNVTNYKRHKRIDFDFDNKSYIIANNLWNKYFKFSPIIEENVPVFDYNNTLGLHYRGTDKNFDYSQTNPITQQEFLYIVDDFLKNNNNIKNIYCCSDEDLFIENVKNRYPNLNIIDYKQDRYNKTSNTDLSGAFFRSAYDMEHDIKNNLTISALIDMVSLSKCKTCIKTSSCLSCFSKIINPDMTVYSLSAMKERWFPTALTEVYKSNSIEINNILNRTLIGNITK